MADTTSNFYSQLGLQVVTWYCVNWVFSRSADCKLYSICDDADNKLFSQITGNSQHLLHSLFPPEREQHYSLRDRSHNFQLPDRTSVTNVKNFIIRMLYNDNSLDYSYRFIELHSFLLCNSVLSVFIKLWMNEWLSREKNQALARSVLPTNCCSTGTNCVLCFSRLPSR